MGGSHHLSIFSDGVKDVSHPVGARVRVTRLYHYRVHRRFELDLSAGEASMDPRSGVGEEPCPIDPVNFVAGGQQTDNNVT